MSRLEQIDFNLLDGLFKMALLQRCNDVEKNNPH